MNANISRRWQIIIANVISCDDLSLSNTGLTLVDTDWARGVSEVGDLSWLPPVYNLTDEIWDIGRMLVVWLQLICNNDILVYLYI